MDKATLGIRLLLGLIFTVFGLNGFFNFLPPPEVNEGAGAFLGALAATGYMFPAIKLVEVVGGVLLLANFMVPFALTILAPIVVNIALFHIVLDTAGLPVALAVLVFEIFLAWAYRGSFRGVLAAKAKPSV